MDIAPCIWFDGAALEAAEFYCSVFPNSSVGSTMRNPNGSPLLVTFTLDGHPFQALNGGAHFRPDEAISFVVPCDGQDEVDRYWDALLADGGEESMCGWLKDRYGVSWQVVPTQMEELFADPDPARVERMTEAMLQMRKLDLAALRAAADGTSTT